MKELWLKIKDKKPYKSVYFYLIILFFIILCFNINYTLVLVNGNSMNPTYKNNDLLLGSKHYKYLDRFDSVVINSLIAKKILIKRIIGLPGETIEYKDNVLYINNEKFIDVYNYDTSDFCVTLDNNSYFCLGDNRTDSADSRIYGPFNESEIIAKITERSQK